jgi:dolichol-phosphate mannosyltransferase
VKLHHYTRQELIPGKIMMNSEKGTLLKAVVVIPTYNERGNIERIVPQILAQNNILHVVIVDDNSPDGTGDLADMLACTNGRINVIHRKTKLGLGSAYRDGFRLALDKGADYIIEMDADFSHDPLNLTVFLERIKDSDMVVGSRYLHGVSVVNWPIRRLMLSYFANVYTRFVTGLQISDCTSGFKCFRREVVEAIDLDNIKSDGYSFQIEMKYRCIEKGFKVSEIPIIFVDRHSGTSKMSRKIVREAIIMVWKLRLGSLRRRFCQTGESHAKRKLGATM